jgi:hypothetical protein
MSEAIAVWGIVCRNCNSELFVAGAKSTQPTFMVREVLRQASIHEAENPGHKCVEAGGIKGADLDKAIAAARTHAAS